MVNHHKQNKTDNRLAQAVTETCVTVLEPYLCVVAALLHHTRVVYIP